ncbi:CLUMA_CG016304, isoform A [Clunio marinus]|uniref:CLUMA_CG016304, isoform A n=1 Tax=Clunio marinus TaxID=568069 RepID=A0A1J1ISX4_9DIPT|nr:CLUMA_CG016304, isoform A [Clunio marinus]
MSSTSVETPHTLKACVSRKMNIGETVEVILKKAQEENRLISGLNNISNFLIEAENSEQSLFFFVVPSTTSDSIAHMQEVVLQSFCFENDIYIIKLDSVEKLNKILGCEKVVSCALVQKMTQAKDSQSRSSKYTDFEMNIIDHCEEFWDELVQPIIKLPEK